MTKTNLIYSYPQYNTQKFPCRQVYLQTVVVGHNLQRVEAVSGNSYINTDEDQQVYYQS